eukprot:INCI5055.11.p1 GENE.INCI5055.11~~INCI5055.11.p1  ORF type:complete len:1492 (-),score=210.22 INCI5055.11:4311-8489(-)
MEIHQTHKREWLRVLRSVNHERGAWARRLADGSIADHQHCGQEHTDAEERVYWKLSNSEDPIRRRGKLKRNYAGSNYAEASVWAHVTSGHGDKNAQEDTHEAAEGVNVQQGNIGTARSPRATAKHDELLDDLERALRRGNDRKRAGDDMDGIEQTLNDASGGGGSSGKGSSDGSSGTKLSHPTLGPDTERVQILAPLGQIVEPHMVGRSPSASSTVAAQLSSLPAKTSTTKAEVPELRVPAVPYAVSPASSSGASTMPSKVLKNGTIADSRETLSSTQLRAVLLRCRCDVITPMLTTPGTFVITSDELRFVVNVDELRRRQNKEDASSARPKTSTGDSRSQRGVDKSKLLHHARSRTWKVSMLTQVEFRRYQLQNIALEFFFESANAVFVNFCKNSVRNQAYEVIRNVCRPPRVRDFYSVTSSPRSRLRKSGLLEAWQAREITNFDFLMRLNFFAGRTYNDLSQYPIFPWVLSDYTSDTLDLRDPRVYRNLGRPIAVQKDSRMEYFRKRYADSKRLYEQMQASNKEMSSLFYPVPRHYSTHYSNPQIVLWYLLRLDPFTAAHIHLQDGVFDIADRQFHSIAAAWRGSNSNDHDVKELIPEFFYLPDFLRNVNNLDLGIKQNTKERLGDVVLPPWAHGSAEEFVRLHREALESDFVSRNLHKWVDLIFGCKQRGPYLSGGTEEASQVCNVFANATYEDQIEGGLELLKLERPEEFRFRIKMINSFGQTPPLLLKRPCIPRRNPEECPLKFPIFSRHCYDAGICTRIVGFDTATVGSAPGLSTKSTDGGSIASDSALFSGRSMSSDSPSRSASFSDANTTNNKVPEELLNCTFLKQKQHAHHGRHQGYANVERFATVSTAPILAFVHSQEYSILATIDARRQVLSHRWFIDENIVSARTCSLELDSERMKYPAYVGAALARAVQDHHTLWPVNTYASVNCLRSTYWRSGGPRGQGNTKGRRSKLLFSGGHWDNSLTVTSLGSIKPITKAFAHREAVACVAVSATGRFVATGSLDSTVIIWRCHYGDDDEGTENSAGVPTTGASGRHGSTNLRHGDAHRTTADAGGATSNAFKNDGVLRVEPMHFLYGHDLAVRCVDMSEDFDIVVSGSDDGTIICHDLKSGKYVRSIECRDDQSLEAKEETQNHSTKFSADNGSTATGAVDNPRRLNRRHSFCLQNCEVKWLGISATRKFVAYTSNLKLSVYSINGILEAQARTIERLFALTLSKDGVYLVTGGSKGMIKLRSTYSLDILWECGDLERAPLPKWRSSVLRAGGGIGSGAEAITHHFSKAPPEPQVHGEPFTLRDPSEDLERERDLDKRHRRGSRGRDRRDSSASDHATSSPRAPKRPAAIRSLLFTQDEMFLAVGLEDGRFAMYTPDKEYIIKRLQMQLGDLGF